MPVALKISKNRQDSCRGNSVRNFMISDQVLTTRTMRSLQLNLTEEQLRVLYQSLLQSQQTSDSSTISSLLVYIESVLCSTSTTSGSATSPGSLPSSGLFRTSLPSLGGLDDDERTLFSQSPSKATTPARTLPSMLESDDGAIGSEILIGAGIGLTGESISELLYNLATMYFQDLDI